MLVNKDSCATSGFTLSQRSLFVPSQLCEYLSRLLMADLGFIRGAGDMDLTFLKMNSMTSKCMWTISAEVQYLERIRSSAMVFVPR